MAHWFLRKASFKSRFVNDFGPRSINDLDLEDAHTCTFIHSLRCAYILTLRSQAAIVSGKAIVFTFSYKTAPITKVGLALK